MIVPARSPVVGRGALEGGGVSQSGIEIDIEIDNNR